MKRILLIAAMAMVTVAGFAQPKFAHVNASELIELTPEADQAYATIVASQKEAQDTFQAMLDEREAKYKVYEEKSATWNQATREVKEKEIVDMEKRIQEFQQNVTAELQQQQQALFEPIAKKVNDTIQEIAKAGGYIFVFDKLSNGLVYIDETQSVDITAACRKALDISDDRTIETVNAERQALYQNAQ